MCFGSVLLCLSGHKVEGLKVVNISSKKKKDLLTLIKDELLEIIMNQLWPPKTTAQTRGVLFLILAIQN